MLLRFDVPVWSDTALVASAERQLAAVPEFSGVVGPLDANGSTLAPTGYRTESQFISPDGRTVLFDAGLTVGDPGSNAALRQVPAIRASVAAVARDVGASSYGVAGQAPATYDISQVSDHDLLHIFPVAIIVIAILLALVMRSLVAPVYLIASVVISYLAAFGLSVLLFQDAAGSGGLPYFIPFLMFLFLLALLVPSTVALLGRWNWWPSRHGAAAGEVSEGQRLAGTCGR